MPADPDNPVPVHSVQEEYFYMMVHPCSCGGPWQSRSQTIEERDDGTIRHHVTAACFRCGREHTFHFALDHRPDPKTPVREINPTDEPSRALDLAEWLRLAEFYLGRVERLPTKVEKAQSLLDARQCLEEARKFFGPDQEEPPPEALWSEASRRWARRHPDTCRRSAVEAMLARLPPLERLRQADALDQKAFSEAVRAEARRRAGRRRWWQFWKGPKSP